MSKNSLDYGDARLYLIHALTALHVGSGQGTGFIDLPIMREKTTGWPIIPGSSVKGVWLDHAIKSTNESSKIKAAFGKAEHDSESDHAGSFAITDARVLLLPVRSFYGTFAYVTSPLVLTRLVRDMEMARIKTPTQVPVVQNDSNILLTKESVLEPKDNSAKSVVLFEDLSFKKDVNTSASEHADKWADFLGNILFKETLKEMLRSRFAIVPDSAFDYFSQHGTEVNTRIKIQKEKKVVEHNALWNEEYLPAETVLAGVVWCDQVYGSDQNPKALLDKFCKEPIYCQMGGKLTIGKGRVRCLFNFNREEPLK